MLNKHYELRISLSCAVTKHLVRSWWYDALKCNSENNFGESRQHFCRETDSRARCQLQGLLFISEHIKLGGRYVRVTLFLAAAYLTGDISQVFVR